MKRGYLCATAALLLPGALSACRGAPVRQELAGQASSVAEARAPAASAEVVHAPSPLPPQASASVAPGLEPLAAPTPFVPLGVEGFRDAVVSLPEGATAPRPVVVALHGNFDRPEWQCEVMREITRGYPFILCPRGVPRGDVPKSWDRWEYAGVAKTKQELEAGLAALAARFPAYVDPGPVVFTGFSLGAILGRSIVREDPTRYPRGVFTEGGHDGWDFKRFKEKGGSRLIFACAQAGCAQVARGVAKQAARAGVELHVADGGNVGHTYDGKVAAAIQAEWSWLVEGDARWPSSAAQAP